MFSENKMSHWKSSTTLNTSVCRKAAFIWQERLSLKEEGNTDNCFWDSVINLYSSPTGQARLIVVTG